MAYRKVRAGLGGAPHARDLENEELQASAELEWDMEKELEEPGTDNSESTVLSCALLYCRFQLGDGELQAVGNSSRVADLDMETIQPSASPHGRFERLEEDPDYVTHFTRPAPKTSTRRPGSPLLCYALLGSVLFIFGLVIGRFACRPAPPSSTTPPPPTDTADLLRKILADITAENIRRGVR
ncbi:hypothetical protein GJAV_G00072700 [Gymnothorax javanicus]|nr:hypothetical protein GJAV_G00072700 [Gymnothorax javanicus]